MFIAVDGGDGAGKSAQIAHITNWLQNRGREVAFFRDPGDTPLGDALREILLARKDLAICSESETALFMAARAQLVRDRIRPALADGKVVLVDRFLLSTVVYQGYAVDGDAETIWRLGTRLTGGLLPDVTFVLDCPTDVAFGRINRTRDRIESKGAEFHRRVRDGFLRAVEDWKRFDVSGKAFVVDATQTPEEVSAEIVARLQETAPELADA
ncbi:MAG: dTMP kinase [Thermoguttaceae bacterium]|nr:dTMP kinase [Thermoguttaceae bacterium]